MRAEKCSNCQYFYHDTERPQCMIPIWENGTLHLHFTNSESWCALYEKAEERNETERH